MIATHAVGAMTVPVGAVILHGDVLQGAVIGADTAAYAGAYPASRGGFAAAL